MKQIIIAVDSQEAQQFADYLNANGYSAKVGKETWNYIDGASTMTDSDASNELNRLWEQYCNA